MISYLPPLQFAASKLQVLEMMKTIAQYITDKCILERIVPYLVSVCCLSPQYNALVMNVRLCMLPIQCVAPPGEGCLALSESRGCTNTHILPEPHQECSQKVSRAVAFYNAGLYGNLPPRSLSLSFSPFVSITQ